MMIRILHSYPAPDSRTGGVTPVGPLARRLALSVALAGLVAGCWLPRLAAAQEAPRPSGPDAPTTSPAQPGTPTPPDAAHATDAKAELPHSGDPTQTAAAETSHGEAGETGHVEEKKEFELHLPTWLYAPLKTLWHSGPAILSAEGAVDVSGQPISGAELLGKQVDYVHHEGHGSPKQELKLRPTLGAIGNTLPLPGMERGHLSVDGREIELLNPKVAFPYQSMFPEHLAMSLVTGLLLLGVLYALTRTMKRVPDRKQSILEMGYSGLDTFVGGVIGPGYEKYLPLIGTLFLYIFFMNIGVMIPGWGSATANINVTAGLALVVFVYVQYEGIRVNGIGGYLNHFVGEPKWLVLLNFPLHVIGEFARLLSLSLRLFGNIFGEDTVIIILIGLMAMFGVPWLPAQLLMYPLSLFAGVVQAMVFCLLTCIYLAMMTAHEDHGHEEGHGHEGPDHSHTHTHAAA